VIMARKKYGVKYPDLYAPHGHANKKEFDCAQRGHQNTLEMFPAVAALAIVDGMVFPVTTAVCVGIWCIGRLMYIHGYSSGLPEKRQLGGLVAHLGDVPLFFMAFVAANKALSA